MVNSSKSVAKKATLVAGVAGLVSLGYRLIRKNKAGETPDSAKPRKPRGYQTDPAEWAEALAKRCVLLSIDNGDVPLDHYAAAFKHTRKNYGSPPDGWLADLIDPAVRERIEELKPQVKPV